MSTIATGAALSLAESAAFGPTTKSYIAATGKAATVSTMAATNVKRTEKAMISLIVSCAAESTMKLHSNSPTSHAG
jgi:hypothetical protein